MAEAAKKSALEAVRAEVDSEEVVDDGTTVVKLEGRNGNADIRVLSPLDWADDWRDYLSIGDYRGLARTFLSEDELGKWAQCAPTIRQAMEFWATLNEAMLASSGESSAS